MAQLPRGGRSGNNAPCCRGTIQSPVAIISRAALAQRDSSPHTGTAASRVKYTASTSRPRAAGSHWHHQGDRARSAFELRCFVAHEM